MTRSEAVLVVAMVLPLSHWIKLDGTVLLRELDCLVHSREKGGDRDESVDGDRRTRGRARTFGAETPGDHGRRSDAVPEQRLPRNQHGSNRRPGGGVEAD